MPEAIECVNLERVYTSKSLFGKKQETRALKGISFTARQGTVFSLLGPNGSGKTTTMRILSTLLTPTGGNAYVHGVDVAKNPSDARKHIGLILGGDRGFYGRLTGRENLWYFAILNKMTNSEIKERVTETLTQVGMTEAADMAVEKYSKGMKQRLHIARGILTNPDVVLMDEPTIGLDPEGAHELRALIPRFTSQGKTILLTTHYMSEADELSNQIAIINKGTIVAAGTPSEIKKNFSKTSVAELILRRSMRQETAHLMSLPGMREITQTEDGPIRKMTLYMESGVDNKANIMSMLGEDNIEYFTTRDATLEEAYLSIVQKTGS